MSDTIRLGLGSAGPQNTEKTLQESEALANAIVPMVNSGIIVINESGGIL